MTSINYRYSNDDKKMVMGKLGSSLTLAFVRTVKVGELLPTHRSNGRLYVLYTPQLRREEAAEEDEVVPRQSYFQNTEGSAFCGSGLQNICAFSNGPQVATILFINKMAYKAYVGLN